MFPSCVLRSASSGLCTDPNCPLARAITAYNHLLRFLSLISLCRNSQIVTAAEIARANTPRALQVFEVSLMGIRRLAGKVITYDERPYQTPWR